MDVEGRFVWTPVSMVRMLQRYVITSRWGHGPQALRALRASPHPSPLEMTRYSPSSVEGDMGEKCLHRGVFVKHTLTRPAVPSGLLCASPRERGVWGHMSAPLGRE